MRVRQRHGDTNGLTTDVAQTNGMYFPAFSSTQQFQRRQKKNFTEMVVPIGTRARACLLRGRRVDTCLQFLWLLCHQWRSRRHVSATNRHSCIARHPADGAPVKRPLQFILKQSQGAFSDTFEHASPTDCGLQVDVRPTD